MQIDEEEEKKENADVDNIHGPASESLSLHIHPYHTSSSNNNDTIHYLFPTMLHFVTLFVGCETLISCVAFLFANVVYDICVC